MTWVESESRNGWGIHLILLVIDRRYRARIIVALDEYWGCIDDTMRLIGPILAFLVFNCLIALRPALGSMMLRALLPEYELRPCILS